MSEFVFRNLDDDVRLEMLQELNSDLQQNTVYVSKRLTKEGQKLFPKFLGEAALGHNPAWLALALKQEKFWNTHEQRVHQTEGTKLVKVPSNAHELLANNQFNRYYMRAICITALKRGINEVEVYRARETSRPRPEHDQLIGKKLSAIECLEQLRTGRSELGTVDSNYGLSLTF